MPSSTPLRAEFHAEPPELPSEFAHPPLIESWLGVEFIGSPFPPLEVKDWRQRLGPEWSSAWQSIGVEQHHAPGMSQVEREIRNVMNDRAIRIGDRGFSFGWLGHDGSIYPRYEAIRDGFVATLDAVRELMPTIGFPRRFCVSYLNKVPQGTVWTSNDDWSFFRLWQPCPLGKLKIRPEGFAGLWQFPLDVRQGVFTIELTHESAQEPSAETQTLWLRLTAAGPTDANESSLFDGLDYGRETIVRAFNELVTADAKEFWGVSSRKKP